MKAAKRPIPADAQPITVEVVALDWKWLFIYPDQGIALVNLALIRDELAAGLLRQPFGPELAGHDFRLVWPQASDADPAIATLRAWLLDEVATSPAAGVPDSAGD